MEFEDEKLEKESDSNDSLEPEDAFISADEIEQPSEAKENGRLGLKVSMRI